jgi:hypothetical protein
VKAEHYVQLQGRKSLKYGEKQHFQHYLTVPTDFTPPHGFQPGQTFRCTSNGKGVLVYAPVQQKPITERLTYHKWLDVVSRLTPASWPGKTYRQICREGGISLRSAPAIWVRQAEKELGLARTKDPKTHRILWSLDLQRSKPSSEKSTLEDAKLTDILQ